MTNIMIVTQWEGRSWEGRIEGITLDNIFRYFNRVEDSDATRLLAIGYDLQSLTAGDLINLDGQWYLIAGVGFEAVSVLEATRLWRRMELAARIRTREENLRLAREES